MNPWVPDADPHQARRIGKTLEELSELSCVLARISIQGMDGIDPASGKSNRERLIDETADVLAQCYRNMHKLNLPVKRILERILQKDAQMDEWDRLLEK